MKPRVTGIGGIFFRAKSAERLRHWYRKHLGLPIDPAWGGCEFFPQADRRKKKRAIVLSVFEANTRYFKPGRKEFMINFRVTNLKRVLAALKREGVWVDPKTEESEFGKFGWIMDPEGQRIELWEPPRN